MNDKHNDVLGAVSRFVSAYAHEAPEIPRLAERQIIRGWNAFTILPNDGEYCIITQTNSKRLAYNAYTKQLNHYQDNTEIGTITLLKSIEHTIQVDFIGSSSVSNEVVFARANALEIVANSMYAAQFFKKINPNLSLLYADDIVSIGEMGNEHAVRSKHSIVLHINEVMSRDLPVGVIEDVNLKVKEATTDIKKEY